MNVGPAGHVAEAEWPVPLAATQPFFEGNETDRNPVMIPDTSLPGGEAEQRRHIAVHQVVVQCLQIGGDQRRETAIRRYSGPSAGAET